MVVSLDATKEHVWEIANLLFLVLEKFDDRGKFQENHPVPSLSIEHLKHIYQKEAPIISTDIAGDQKIFPSLLPSILLTWAYRRASYTCHLGGWSLSGGRSIFLSWAFAFVCPSGGSIHPLILIWWVPSHAPDLTSDFISSKDSFLSPNQKVCPSPTITLCYFTPLIKFISLTAMHGYLLLISPY